MAKAKPANVAGEEKDEAPKDVCGIVMPISKSATHEPEHWTCVQELVHRAVRNAGLEPLNVWMWLSSSTSKSLRTPRRGHGGPETLGRQDPR